MAFGNFDNQQQSSPSVFGYSFFNKESIIDKTMISFSMWRNNLKIAISPVIESENGETRYDTKNGISVYLTPQKAKMFEALINQFLQASKEEQQALTQGNIGVASGNNLITVEDPEVVYGKPEAGIVISIKKLNENGQIEQAYSYETRKGFYNAIVGFDPKTAGYTQDFDHFNTLELEMISLQLREYYTAMSNAQAYSSLIHTQPYLNKIAAKLGVDLDSNYNGGYKNKSYFNNGGGNNQATHTSAGTTESIQSSELDSIMGSMQ